MSAALARIVCDTATPGQADIATPATHSYDVPQRQALGIACELVRSGVSGAMSHAAGHPVVISYPSGRRRVVTIADTWERA